MAPIAYCNPRALVCHAQLTWAAGPVLFVLQANAKISGAVKGLYKTVDDIAVKKYNITGGQPVSLSCFALFSQPVLPPMLVCIKVQGPWPSAARHSSSDR